MGTLRFTAEADLETSLEGDFGLPVTLQDADGASQTVQGQILYDTIRTNPDSGDEMVVNNPVVTVRRSSLNTIPAKGEKWIVQIPESPTAGAAIITFMLDDDRAAEGGSSIGFIRLYLRKVKQQPV